MSFWKKNGDGSFTPADDKKLDDVEFKPEVFKTELSTEFKTLLAEQETKHQETMKPLLDMAASINKDREDRAEAQRKAAETKRTEDSTITDEDFLLDPMGSVDKKLSGTNTAVRMLAARMAKQDTLGEKEYYHGEIKSKVDAMLAAQTLEAQMRPDVVENCYKLVMFDHMKDISDGKIKARNSAGTFEGGSTGAPSGTKSEGAEESMTAEEKLVASRMGVSEKDWISSRKELQYV